MKNVISGASSGLSPVHIVMLMVIAFTFSAGVRLIWVYQFIR